ncbi:DUF4230 domain-containing protein [Paucihalobacter sp.]|uniref:DUF4230 domain-containing protein n=1 Tax=Paucihalobacter sp. TaxID=2850405 RepID=UPI002FE0B1B9
MEAFLGLIIGVLISGTVWYYFKTKKNEQLTRNQSVILLDKIKKVCKFITVEGDFTEIYHHEDVKEKFLKLVISKKKALVVIKAKAHIGFDLSKIIITTNSKAKTVILSQFPQPEVLSIETNLNYYDIKNGAFNKFDAEDMTALTAQTKEHIKAKIPESGLFSAAQREALEAIAIMQHIVETIGWKLDYSALELEAEATKVIK